MEAGARATLDDPILRRRLRSEFTPSYTRRTFVRPRPALISDVTERRYQAPTPSISPQIVQHFDVPKPLTDLDSSSPQISVRHNPATVQTHIDSTKPLAHRSITTFLKNLLAIRRKSKLQVALLALAITIILAGGYISYLGLRANHVAVAQAAKLTAQANKASKSTKSSSNTTPALSTVKPSANALANYVVAPNLPRYIMIPKLGVDTIVESVGVNSQGALETPDNVYDTAWYNESAEPGQPGAMLIDGHVSSWTAHGVFYGIKTLVAGDIIKIVRGDGTVFTYSVVKNQVFPSGNVNMTSAMTPVVAGQPGLNLITCTGDVIPGTSEFNERIVVYATLQQ